VVQFAFVNAIVVAVIDVLGPVVAKTHYEGARSWGLVLAAYSVGSVLGGVAMIRLRPARILLAATIPVFGGALMLFALAPPLTALLVALAALLAGACFQVFGINWATTMQQEIPPGALSRVSAYDALGSLVLSPAGAAVAGPLADEFGPSPVLVAGGVLIVVLTAAVLLVPEVRQLRHRTPAAALAPGHAPEPAPDEQP
jgi:predicted MFS family arabinose efflux permease